MADDAAVAAAAEVPPATEPAAVAPVEAAPAAGETAPAADVAPAAADSAPPAASGEVATEATPSAAEAATAPTEAPVTADTKWVYLDDAGAQQGPFGTTEISGWYAAGYLKGHHQVKQEGSEAPFQPLSEVPALAPAAAPPAAAPVGYGGEMAAMMPTPGYAAAGAATGPPAGKLLGEVKNWNEEKGFGFIIPSGGGEDIFAHRTDLSSTHERPALARGTQVAYSVGTGNDGRARAKDVTMADGTPIATGAMEAAMGGMGGGMGYGGMGGFGGMGGGGQKMMGVVKNWNDEKGFGFIDPSAAPLAYPAAISRTSDSASRLLLQIVGGGENLFVHRTEIVAAGARPVLQRGQQVMYELGNGKDGRPRATGVCSADGTPVPDQAMGGMGGGYAGYGGGMPMGGGGYGGGMPMGGGGYGQPMAGAGGYGQPQAGGYGQAPAGGQRYAPY
eukprot:SAG11_NODE_1120_length_5789_cov_12.068190_6_plen_446_part_00